MGKYIYHSLFRKKHLVFLLVDVRPLNSCVFTEFYVAYGKHFFVVQNFNMLPNCSYILLPVHQNYPKIFYFFYFNENSHEYRESFLLLTRSESIYSYFRVHFCLIPWTVLCLEEAFIIHMRHLLKNVNVLNEIIHV